MYRKSLSAGPKSFKHRFGPVLKTGLIIDIVDFTHLVIQFKLFVNTTKQFEETNINIICSKAIILACSQIWT